MTVEQHRCAINKLMQVPGIGRTEADSLVVLGITEIHHLKGLNAENLYRRLNREVGVEYPSSLITTLKAAIGFANGS